MKLVPSPFSSTSSTISSSTTTYSFHSKSATASCIAGILRRILCSGTLPTYPADHVTEYCTNSVKCHFNPDDHHTNPGLVARLMGLDSMPETNFRTSLTRSRSANSADGLMGDDASEARHRRVKSTASFRESQIPVFLELQDKEFLVLSFEGVRPKGAKSETGFGESKPRRRVRARKEEDEEKVKVLTDLNGKDTVRRRRECITLVPKKTSSLKNESREEKNCDNVVYSNGVKPSLKKKKKKKKKKKTNCDDCEDSSPVSVLDCGQFLVDPKATKSVTGDGCSSTPSSSRRKLSLENEGPSPQKDHDLVGDERNAEKYLGLSSEEENSNVLDEICRVSESELLGQKWNFDHQDFGGIGEEFEASILGQLIQELVELFSE